MQLIQLFLPAGHEDVLDTLESADVDYVRVPAEDRDGTVVYFPLPDEGVDEVLHELRDVGLPDDAYTVVTGADTVTAPHFQELRERYAESEQDESIPSEQLHDQAEDLNPSWYTFTASAVLAAVVVAAGLLRNSAAAVAGAMVIAPYFGTALSVSVGAVSADRYLLINGLKHQVVGLVVSIASAAAVGLVARHFALVPPGLDVTTIDQVGIFVTPSALSLGIAVAAGVAGAITFATAQSTTISGVAIAAAIIPSAGAVGLGLAWSDPVIVGGSLALLLLNVACINLAAIAVLLVLGHRPSSFDFERHRDDGTVRVVVGAVGVILLAAVAGGALYASANYVAFDRHVNAAVHDVTQRPPYDALAVSSVTVAYHGPLAGSGPEDVVVTVHRRQRRDYPHLTRAMERRVEKRTGRDVDVHVRFVSYEGTAPQSPSNGSSGSKPMASTAASTRSSGRTTVTPSAASAPARSGSGATAV